MSFKKQMGTKVTTIKEAQDLKTLKLDDLIGKLLTCEIHLHEESDEQAPKQGIALKSIDEGLETQSEESSDGEDEIITMTAI